MSLDLAEWQAKRAESHFLGNNQGVKAYEDAGSLLPKDWGQCLD
jgi:hypothetical protein